ncbi:RAD52 motif-containing protein 1 [Sarotherodon galilaeus]
MAPIRGDRDCAGKPSAILEKLDYLRNLCSVELIMYTFSRPPFVFGIAFNELLEMFLRDFVHPAEVCQLYIHSGNFHHILLYWIDIW